MILLDKKEYEKGLEPVKLVKFNHLFARAVLENHVDGAVYVDNVNKPTTFYVIHPYGISLLFGNPYNEAFNSKLLEYILNTSQIRQKIEWMQAYPDAWHKKLNNILGDKLIKTGNDSLNNTHIPVEEHTRVNFKFNIDSYLAFKQGYLKDKNDIKRTTKEMYENMGGTVIPKFFWKDADQFCNEGIGFSLIVEGNVVSTAYSAFVFKNKLELGIETQAGFRGKGYAVYCCSALIDYCLENNYEPIWSCRFENTGSYKLAQKLGFEPVVFIPFYKLNP